MGQMWVRSAQMGQIRTFSHRISLHFGSFGPKWFILQQTGKIQIIFQYILAHRSERIPDLFELGQICQVLVPILHPVELITAEKPSNR